MARKIYKTLFSISLSLFFLITSFFTVIASEEFYRYEFLRNDISNEVSVANEDLSSIYSSLVEYVKGDKESPQIEVKIAGEEMNFFNEREITHMKDVKYLYVLLKNIYFTIIFAMIVFIIISFLKKLSLNFLIVGQFIFTIFISAGLIFITLNNFTDNFFIFHQMLFSNDLWLLTPSVDRMIDILPEVFFRDMGLFSFISYFVMSFLFMIISKLLGKIVK